MARRKVKTLVNATPGSTLTSGADLHGAGILIPGANVLRIAIIPRTATVLETTATFGTGNKGTVNKGTAIVAQSDNIFETVIAGTLYNARVTTTTVVDKYIVEAYLDY